MEATEQGLLEKFSVTSSIAGDVWHEKSAPDAFEWWYFDAISDDGRDAVVIIFLDNFIFSPRYNAYNKKHRKSSEQSNPSSVEEKHKRSAEAKTFPALAFFYYRDGKPLYRAINEFDPADFEASREKPECRIGESSFRLDSAPYGSGYVLTINAKLFRNRTLRAEFEWLSIEGDFKPECSIFGENSHCWNMVLARSDVSGRISVEDSKGKNLDVQHFRGTGYHDHNIDNRWLPETVQDWQWGRGHFSGASCIFYRYKEIGMNDAVTKLLLVQNEGLEIHRAFYSEHDFHRDIFGIKYPRFLNFQTEDNFTLQVKQNKIIDSSFFYLRFLSEMTLTLADGKPHTTTGITEYLAPKALKYRWLDWLVSMRIGRKGKASLLK